MEVKNKIIESLNEKFEFITGSTKTFMLKSSTFEKLLDTKQ